MPESFPGQASQSSRAISPPTRVSCCTSLRLTFSHPASSSFSLSGQGGACHDSYLFCWGYSTYVLPSALGQLMSSFFPDFDRILFFLFFLASIHGILWLWNIEREPSEVRKDPKPILSTTYNLAVATSGLSCVDFVLLTGSN